MIGSIRHIPDDILLSIGTLILDEAVDFCTEIRYYESLKIHPQYIILCTATPTRPNKLHSMLHLMCGEHRVIRLNQQPFTVIKLMTGVKPVTIKTNEGIDWTFLQYDLYLSERRNHCILDCLLTNYDTHKMMILTNFEVHVDLLVDLCNMYNLSVTRYAGNQKSYDNAKILIGTTKKIGVGFDEKSKCDTYDGIRIDLLFLVCSTKQFESLAQVVGRVFRADFPNVLHFVDNDPRIGGTHWKVAEKWYNDAKGEITESLWIPFKIIDRKQFHIHHNIARNKAIETMKENEKKNIEKGGNANSYLSYLATE